MSFYMFNYIFIFFVLCSDSFNTVHRVIYLFTISHNCFDAFVARQLYNNVSEP